MTFSGRWWTALGTSSRLKARRVGHPRMGNQELREFGKILTYCLLLACTLVDVSIAQSGSAQPVVPLAVSLTADKNVVKLGSDIVVKVAVTNLSQHPVVIPLPLQTQNGETGYLLSLKDSAGQAVPETPYYRKFRCWAKEAPCAASDGSDGFTTNFAEGPLPPGSSWRMEIHLTKLFVISEPGTYTLQAEWGDATGRAIPVGALIESNKLTITIQP